MADGRTNQRYARVYQNGYDLSGESRSIGMLGAQVDVPADSALTWEVKGGFPGQPTIALPPLNTIFRIETDVTTSPYDLISGMNNSLVKVMVVGGVRAAPVMGDPVFMAVNWQNPASIAGGDALLTMTLDYAPSFYDGNATLGQMNYGEPWGVLLHPNGAETAASTATGHDGLAQTTHGGWMICQFLAFGGTGSATVKVQGADANLNASFADLTGLTTGAIAHTAMPCAVVVQSATNLTINRYTRFQVVLAGGLTSVTFVLGFARGK